jgi:fucose permease
MSQQAIQQAMQNYNQFVTPQLAAQNGAGSPALASGAAQYLGNLQAQSSQNAITNYLQGTNTLGNFAYNALGNTLMSNNTANQTQGLNQIGANVNSGGSLASILSALTGLPGYGSP